MVSIFSFSPLNVPPVDQIAQGFDAIFQLTEDLLSSQARVSLTKLQAIHAKAAFHLAPESGVSIDELIAAAIVSKDIIFDPTHSIEFLTSNRQRNPDLIYVSEGLGVTLDFRGLKIAQMGTAPRISLEWDVEAVVQAVQASEDFPSGTDVMDLDGGWPEPLEYPLDIVSDGHRYIEPLAYGRLGIELDVHVGSLEDDPYSYLVRVIPASPVSFYMDGKRGRILLQYDPDAITSVPEDFINQAEDMLRGVGNMTLFEVFHATTEIVPVTESLITYRLGGKTIKIAPILSLGGSKPANMSELEGSAVQMIATPGNLPERPVLSVALEVEAIATAFTDINGIKPFCADRNFAYYASVPIINAGLQALWVHPQAPTKSVTGTADIEFQASDDTRQPGTADVSLTLVGLGDLATYAEGEQGFTHLGTQVEATLQILKAYDANGTELEVATGPPEPMSLMWGLFAFQTHDMLGFPDDLGPGALMLAQLQAWLLDPLYYPFRGRPKLGEVEGRVYETVSAVVVKSNITI